VFDSNTITVWQLLQFDVVICSSNFLKTRYIEGMRCSSASLSMENNTIPVPDPFKYDIVICSSNFLKARYTEAIRMELFGLIANAYDIALAREICPGIGRERRIKVPLHSELYREWNRRIPVVTFDEAHDFKNEETLAQKAAL
jgi:hypothetical protein